MARPEVGRIYADKRSPGRWVEVLEVNIFNVHAETVRAADAASSARAIGRQTWIDAHNFKGNFDLVAAEEIARELPHKRPPEA